MVLVADGPAGVSVLAARAGAALQLVSSIPADDASGIAVNGDLAFVADTETGLDIYRLSGEGHALPLGHLENPIPTYGWIGLDPTPTPTSFLLGMSNDIVDIVVDPRRLDRTYPMYEHGWRIIDVSDPAQPDVIGHYCHLCENWKLARRDILGWRAVGPCTATTPA